jgi:hypothetical protein
MGSPELSPPLQVPVSYEESIFNVDEVDEDDRSKKQEVSSKRK